ncbi:Metallophosphoesterase 1 [Geodia barretti]|uniref:Metallophosphoesterase 1 n=2 Tax=Geodia barretti TaxID=519541 RepID=A0AA35TBE9_GEOBA|nr:Metallophosphoesterase 1 [Geodia barretti]
MAAPCIMIRQRPLIFLSLSLFLLFLFGEFGVHFLYSWMWAWPTDSALPPYRPLDPTVTESYANLEIINAGPDETKQSLKILVLADPHIQCSFATFEPWLLRWDSDRYVARGVSRLLVAMEPDAVVVVGDVFAEGYKASQQDWTDYLQCLSEVLVVPSDVKLILLPGDNDIGGEGGEGMRDTINQRYIAEFGPLNEVLTFRGVTIVKLNTISYIHRRPANQEEAKIREETTSFLSSVSESTARGLLRRPVLVYSHVPLSDLPTAVTVSSSPLSLSVNEATRQSKEANYMSFLDTLLPLPLSLSLISPELNPLLPKSRLHIQWPHPPHVILQSFLHHCGRERETRDGVGGAHVQLQDGRVSHGDWSHFHRSSWQPRVQSSLAPTSLSIPHAILSLLHRCPHPPPPPPPSLQMSQNSISPQTRLPLALHHSNFHLDTFSLTKQNIYNTGSY